MSPGRVLITGSNRGLGRAIASAFHGDGWHVASLNRTLHGAAWMGEVQCDLADSMRTRDAAREAIATLGGLDVCVLNAAVRRLAPVAAMADADWDASLLANLSGAFRVAREAIPALVEARGAFIVVGSQAAQQPFEGGAAYCATKAGLEAFARVLMLEMRPLGVRTTLVTPGAVRNHEGEDGAHKVEPSSLATAIVALATSPPDMLVTELEVRPMTPVPSPLIGIARLQPW